MSCNEPCGSPCLSYEQIVKYIENLVNEKILCGAIQAGLLSCGGTTILPGGTQIVTCAQLAELVDEAIKNNAITIPGIEDLTFDGSRLTLIDQTGKSWQVDLSSLSDKTVQSFTLTADGVLTLTLKDGTTLPVAMRDMLDGIVADAVREAVIKNGVLDADGNLVLTTGNGEQIIIDLSSLGKIAGLIDSNGDLVLTDGNGEQTVIDLSAIRKIFIDRESPLMGNGSKEEPLSIDFTKVCPARKCIVALWATGTIA